MHSNEKNDHIQCGLISDILLPKSDIRVYILWSCSQKLQKYTKPSYNNWRQNTVYLRSSDYGGAWSRVLWYRKYFFCLYLWVVLWVYKGAKIHQSGLLIFVYSFKFE